MSNHLSQAAVVSERDEAFPRALTARIDLRALGSFGAEFVFPFALIVYLAFQGGGYDVVVRSEIGIAAWWIALMAGIAGLVPRLQLGKAGWAVVGAFIAFALWTGLGVSWSSSAERSLIEVSRVLTLLGVFAVALAVQGKQGLPRMLGAIGTAVALIGGVAVLSRLHPSWFPDNDVADFLPSTSARLNYPVNYWNGLATLAAMGIPLLLWAASSARLVFFRAAAAAAVPVLGLTAYLTLSRGGALEIAVGLIAFLALHPRRLQLMPLVLASGAGAGILIAGASLRQELREGLNSAVAHSQGDEMLAMTLVVALGVGLVVAACALAEKYELLRMPKPSRRGTAAVAGGAVAVAIVAAVAAGAPGEISDKWTEFKEPGGPGEGIGRFDSASGNGRYQWWETAVDANATDKLTGIGPGTFEYFWAENGSRPGFVRDAHSLYLESLGELGIVGFALVLGLVGGGTGLIAIRSSFSGLSSSRRSMLATAAAAMLVFAVAAAIDWAWEMTVLPVAFLLLLAAALRAPGIDGETGSPPPFAGLAFRLAVAGVATVALIVIIVPMASTNAVRESQAMSRSGDIDGALTEARRAVDLQPYAASPRLQEALVLEQADDLPAATAAASEATGAEANNWRTWLVLSRLEAKLGNADESVTAYRHARRLNPRSPLFAQ